MDFENFFWIIPLLYLLRRLIFGPRKQKKTRKPATQEPRPALSQKNRNDLQEGLGEIGRALGLPADLFQESVGKTTEPPAPSPIPAAHAEPAIARLPATAAEETMAYDAWAEPIYEPDALFAEEEAFETKGRPQSPDPIRDNLKNQGGDSSDLNFSSDAQATADDAEAPSPLARAATPRHALRRLAAAASLQEAVLLKEILDRPVSLRRSPRLPFRS